MLSTSPSLPSTASIVVAATTQLVTLLEPLSPEERHRAVSAALILLGQSPSGSHKISKGVDADEQEVGNGLSTKAAVWMKKFSITRDQLDSVFSIDESGVDIIASKLPGSSKRQQTIHAYILSGLKSYLITGDVAFDDKNAREFCQKVGCYDVANHANHSKAFGNFIGGTKDIGWKLTNPGLQEAAKIIKELTVT